MKKIISFLGKRPNNGLYPTATYRFPNGKQITQSFFSLAVQEANPADELIILGTSGSMWGNLASAEKISYQNKDEDAELMLIELSEKNQLTATALNDFIEKTQPSYLGAKIRFELMDYALDINSQSQFIAQIAAHFKKGDSAILDITHSLRHLPMLIEKVAELLPLLKEAAIDDIYYGAFEMRDNQGTPVVSLRGIETIASWQKALTLYDATGDMGQLIPLLESMEFPRDGIANLQSSVHFERIHQFNQAYKRAQAFYSLVQKWQTQNTQWQLIAPALKERLEWIKEENSWKRQFSQSYNYLEKGDYFRATLYGFEAIESKIISHITRNERIEDIPYTQKKALIIKYLQELDTKKFPKNQEIKNNYHYFRVLRNTLAHGENDEENEHNRQVVNNAIKERNLYHFILDKLTFFKNQTL